MPRGVWGISSALMQPLSPIPVCHECGYRKYPQIECGFFSSWCEGPFEGLSWGGICSSSQESLQLGVEGTRGHVQGSTLGLFSSSFTSMGPRKAVYTNFNVLSAQFSSVSPQLLSPEFSLFRGSQSSRSTFWGVPPGCLPVCCPLHFSSWQTPVSNLFPPAHLPFLPQTEVWNGGRRLKVMAQLPHHCNSVTVAGKP